MWPYWGIRNVCLKRAKGSNVTFEMGGIEEIQSSFWFVWQYFVKKIYKQGFYFHS